MMDNEEMLTQTPVEGPVEVETEEAVPADDPSAV